MKARRQEVRLLRNQLAAQTQQNEQQLGIMRQQQQEQETLFGRYAAQMDEARALADAQAAEAEKEAQRARLLQENQRIRASNQSNTLMRRVQQRRSLLQRSAPII
jgi:peptidoglycan hydrolase CwlO-like protein